MNPTEFDARLQACLDARRDPLDDEQLVAFLDAHPERLAAFAALRADLGQLRMPPAGLPTSRRRRVATVLGLGLVAAAAAVALVAWLPDGPDARTTGADQQPGQRPNRIVRASLQEVQPLLRAAGSYTVHQRLVRRADTTFEVYEHRSQIR